LASFSGGFKIFGEEHVSAGQPKIDNKCVKTQKVDDMDLQIYT
jgi:hypothetical protein